MRLVKINFYSFFIFRLSRASHTFFFCFQLILSNDCRRFRKVSKRVAVDANEENDWFISGILCCHQGDDLSSLRNASEARIVFPRKQNFVHRPHNARLPANVTTHIWRWIESRLTMRLMMQFLCCNSTAKLRQMFLNSSVVMQRNLTHGQMTLEIGAEAFLMLQLTNPWKFCLNILVMLMTPNGKFWTGKLSIFLFQFLVDIGSDWVSFIFYSTPFG